MEIDRTRAAWTQVRDALLKRLDDGTYPAGSKFPSVLEIAAEFSVANSTAQRALVAIREGGRLRTEPGIGTFVL
ncbi:GntR family transcriptional regulator [Streptomyces sp. NPDC001982]|uniref:GntR family transcriptional regulator n=1 Tax=unclassified Streptomyces TaxID=2593676 RepID=UPI00332F97C6